MKTMTLAASLLALSIAAAAAAEGNGQPFPNEVGSFVVANQTLNDTGSANYPRFGRNIAAVTQGDVLPTNGSQGVVQTANSLPVGAEQGTVTYAQAQSVQRWNLARAARRARLADVAGFSRG